MFYIVTIVSLDDHPYQYEPRAAVFSTREKAEAFKKKLDNYFESLGFGYDGAYYVSIDSGNLDSEEYFEIFRCECEE